MARRRPPSSSLLLHLSLAPALTSACHYTPSSASFPFVLVHYALCFLCRASFRCFSLPALPYATHTSLPLPLIFLPTHSSLFEDVWINKSGCKISHFEKVPLPFSCFLKVGEKYLHDQLSHVVPVNGFRFLTDPGRGTTLGPV